MSLHLGWKMLMEDPNAIFTSLKQPYEIFTGSICGLLTNQSWARNQIQVEKKTELPTIFMVEHSFFCGHLVT